jgi:integrase
MALHPAWHGALQRTSQLRYSFVSLLSDAGVPIEQISRLVGHSGTTTTETVYRKQIRPVITDGRGHHGPDLSSPCAQDA